MKQNKALFFGMLWHLSICTRNVYSQHFWFRLAKADRHLFLSMCISHVGSPPLLSDASLLHFACRYCSNQVISTVFSYFPGMVNLTDNENSTPLHVATSLDKVDIVKLFLTPCVAAGDGEDVDRSLVMSDLNVLDKYGRSPLYLACENGSISVAELLLVEASKRKATPTNTTSPINVNCFAKTGRTPLHEAVWNGGRKLVEMLLEHGADVHALASPTYEAERIIDKAADCALENQRHEPDKLFGHPGSAVTSDDGVGNQSRSVDCLDDYNDCSHFEDTAMVSSSNNLLDSLSGEDLEQETHRTSSSTCHHFHKQNGNRLGIKGRRSVSAAALEHKKTDTNKVGPLVEACVRGKVKIVDCLLRWGATDKHGLALCVSMFKSYEIITKRLLSRQNRIRSREMRGEQDKINKTNAIAISWRGLRLVKIDPEWLSSEYLNESKNGSEDCPCLIDTLEDAVSPAVTLYFEQSCQQHLEMNQLTPITWLNLRSNRLLQVPVEVFRIDNLLFLDVSDNLLTELPGGCQLDGELQRWTCKSLSSLNVSRNRLVAVPQCLLSLTELTNLNLAKNQLTCLEESSKENMASDVWHKLKTLNVSENHLRMLPSLVFRCPLLEELNVSKNEINNIPASLWTAPFLRSLNLSDNLLSTLLDKSLALEKELRKTLSSTSSSTKSRFNGVDSNDWTTDAYTEKVLTSSSWVEVTKQSVNPLSGRLHGNNEFEIVSKGTTLMPGEEKPELTSYWPISEDASEEKLTENESGLRSLNLSRNKFDRPPIGLACLAPNLIELDLSHNKLYQLGSLCQYPAQLRTLNLSNNQLVTTKVQVLRHHMCYSIDKDDTAEDSHCAHQYHQTLTKLKKLNLNYNKLSSVRLQLPESAMKSRMRLRSAHHRDNQGEDQLSLLFPSLEELLIAQNGLTSLPSSLGLQKHLRILHVNQNPDLAELPLQLGRLKGVIYDLSLDANQMLVPPPAIATGNPRQILTYLYSLEQE